MSDDYIERSAGIVSAFDPEEIGNLCLGPVVGEDDCSVQYALGKTIVAGETLHLGIKLPAKSARLNPNMLLTYFGLVPMTFLGQKAPELLANAPRFMGKVATVNEYGTSNWGLALLTEDVTQGGSLQVQPVSVELVKRLETVHEFLIARQPLDSLLTVVGQEGYEKLATIPGYGTTYDRQDPIMARVREYETALSVPLGEGSKLLASLKDHGQDVLT